MMRNGEEIDAGGCFNAKVREVLDADNQKVIFVRGKPCSPWRRGCSRASE